MQELSSSINHLMTKEFGNKAITLKLIKESIGPVPDFFLLAKREVKEIFFGTISTTKLIDLENEFEKFIKKSKSGKVIVRSSSVYEDIENASFAGLFKSYSNISNFSELLRAIKQCFANSRNTVIDEYSKSNELVLNDEHMAIIIQEQIDADVSGIAYVDINSLYIEFTSGDLKALIQGQERVLNKLVHIIDKNETKLISTSCCEGVCKEIKQAIPMLKKVAKCIDFDQTIIEFGINKKQLHIFQARPTHILKDIIPSSPIFSNNVNNIVGEKALAMNFFSKHGLFSEKFLLCPPNTPDNILKDTIEDAKYTENDFLTVRSSMKNAISLPRKFIKGKATLFELLKQRPPTYTTIIHKYLDVIQSFELIVNENNWALEHVPGLWESDNVQQPDALYFSNNKLDIWQFDKNRLAKFQNEKNITYHEVSPLTKEEIILWSYQVKKIVQLLRETFKNVLPVNAHFVAIKDGSWQFLNLRPALAFSNAIYDGTDIKKISNLDDLFDWDGRATLVLSVFVNRGEESCLLSLARALPKDRVIFIDFGILSHPAMVLQEFGCLLQPSYLLTNSFTEKAEYNHYSIEGDILLEPYDRIMDEQAIIENESYHVVPDRSPITKSHTLIVAKSKCPSIADSLPSDLISLVDEKIFKDCSDIMYFERGRAQFCTSGFTTEQAHAHVFLQEEFEESTIVKFALHTQSNKILRLKDALEEAQRFTGEYLVFGSRKYGYYIKLNFNPILFEKRLIRNFLKKMKVNNLQDVDK